MLASISQPPITYNSFFQAKHFNAHNLRSQSLLCIKCYHISNTKELQYTTPLHLPLPPLPLPSPHLIQPYSLPLSYLRHPHRWLVCSYWPYLYLNILTSPKQQAHSCMCISGSRFVVLEYDIPVQLLMSLQVLRLHQHWRWASYKFLQGVPNHFLLALEVCNQRHTHYTVRCKPLKTSLMLVLSLPTTEAVWDHEW